MADQFEYEILTEAEKLTQAKDALRAKEIDHYRLSILAPSESSAAGRLDALEAQIVELREVVSEQEKVAEEAAPKSVVVEPAKDAGKK
jgi:hypothetical protein